jgi:hypothetical protein
MFGYSIDEIKVRGQFRPFTQLKNDRIIIDTLITLLYLQTNEIFQV